MRTMGSSGPARTFRFRVTGLKTDGLAADSVCDVAFASMNRLGCLKEPGNCLQEKKCSESGMVAASVHSANGMRVG